MKTFEELGVSPEIRRAIEEMGYAYPKTMTWWLWHRQAPERQRLSDCR